MVLVNIGKSAMSKFVVWICFLFLCGDYIYIYIILV